MAIAKVILNGEVQMDVTSDTVEANKLLEGETATKNDGTKVTGTFVAPDPEIAALTVTPTLNEQVFSDPFSSTDMFEFNDGERMSDENGILSADIYWKYNMDNIILGQTYHLSGKIYVYEGLEFSQSSAQSVIFDTDWIASSDAIDISFTTEPFDPGSFNSDVEIISIQLSTTSMNITATKQFIAGTYIKEGFYVQVDRRADGFRPVTVEAIPIDELLADSYDSDTIYPSTEDQLIPPDTYYSFSETPDEKHPVIPTEGKASMNSYKRSTVATAELADNIVYLYAIRGTVTMHANFQNGHTTASASWTIHVDFIPTYYISRVNRFGGLNNSYVDGFTTDYEYAFPNDFVDDMLFYATAFLVQFNTSYTASKYSIYVDSCDIALYKINYNGFPAIKPFFTVKGITETMDITANGNYDVLNYASANVSVSVDPALMSKTVDPTESIQTVTPDTGYDGLSQVIVNAISSTYIGSAIPLKSSADLTTNGSTVFVSSGYYSSDARTNVAAVTSLPSVSFSFATDPGEEYATYTMSYSFTTSGFVSTGTHSEITGSWPYYKARTITPNPDHGYVVIGNAVSIAVFEEGAGGITVDAIPSSYIIPSGTYSVTENGTYDIGSYASVDVSVAGGGGGLTPDDIALRNISGSISGSANCIGSYAFANCNNLSTVSFPVCTTISNYAFSYCSNLGTASFPSCKTISTSAFANCHNLSTVSFPVCTTIGNGAFAYCSNLGTASFPSCTTIGNNAFAYCSNLGTASFPSCTTISNAAFDHCSILSTVSFPVCTMISNTAFAHCYNLSTVSFPSCTTIGSGAFSYCSNLGTASFPSCTTIYGSAFAYCSNLGTASFPSCTLIGASAFARCSNLSTVSFPSCTSIYGSAFAYCYNLSTVSFPSCTSIHGNAFANCYNLLSLYLLGSSRAWLVNQNAFVSTPISNYTTSTGGIYGSIFVPASLYDSYISATNWSAYSSRIVGLSFNTLTEEMASVVDPGAEYYQYVAPLTSYTSLISCEHLRITINDNDYGIFDRKISSGTYWDEHYCYGVVGEDVGKETTTVGINTVKKGDTEATDVFLIDKEAFPAGSTINVKLEEVIYAFPQ